MSRKSCKRVSKSSPQSRSQSPSPVIEPLPSSLEADIARMVNDNPNREYSVSNDEWQMWDTSRSNSGSLQAPNRILTIIPNFHGAVSPLQCPPELEDGWIKMNSGLHAEEPPHLSSTWFGPPIPQQHNVLSDGRFFQPFLGPTPGGPPYPIPYLVHSPPMPMPMPLTRFIGDDATQWPFQEFPIEQERQPHFAGPNYAQSNLQPGPSPGSFPPFSPIRADFNPYPTSPPIPEFGNYYLVSPPEPFAEYAFVFDSGFRPNQGQPHYPMPPQQSPLVDNHNNSHHHLLPGFPPLPGAVPSPGQQVGPPEMSAPIPPPPSQYLYPLPPHIVISPPSRQDEPDMFHSPENFQDFSKNYNLQNTGSPTICGQNIPRSLVWHQPVKLPDSPHRIKRRDHFSANAASNPPQKPLALSTQSGRKLRRIFIPVVRSPLLERFRSERENSPNTWTIQDIFGHVVEFSMDQHGSRFIQSKLELVCDEEKQRIFLEIFPENAEKLIQDVFGNYVIQKFFDVGTSDQKDAFTEVVQQHVVKFSLDIYGCRVVQKAIDSISEHQQAGIIQCLGQDVLECITDANGNHVIQKLVQSVPPQRLTFLPVICDNILFIATHLYGCRVLQRCLEHLPKDLQRNLLNSIHRYTLEFIHDQYGNYVTQYIIEHGEDSDRAIAVSSILGYLVTFAQHKYASNVCEKALFFSDSATRYKLIEEILTPPHEIENHIVSMMEDQYSNYVLQRALVVVEGEQRHALYSHVKPVVISLRTGCTSAHINRSLLSIERLVGDYFGNSAQSESGGPA